MSIEARIEELQRRHAKIDREIHAKIINPATDTLDVAQLKRRKLQLKDEMTRLKGNQQPLSLH